MKTIAFRHLLIVPWFAWLAACTPTGQPAPSHPSDKWAMDAESAAIWGIRNSTPLHYALLPQMISARTPQHGQWTVGGHELTMRSRFSLLVEPVARGPESLYVGVSAGPSFEYWFAGDKACWYAGAGGGCGVIDSTDVPGGQGQDFTLNWYATTGVRYYPKPNLSIHGGAFFQHLSNGGATDPNPGINAVGPVVGITGHF